MTDDDRPEWVPDRANEPMIRFECANCELRTPQKHDSPIREKVDRGDVPISHCPNCKKDGWAEIDEWEP